MILIHNLTDQQTTSHTLSISVTSGINQPRLDKRSLNVALSKYDTSTSQVSMAVFTKRNNFQLKDFRKTVSNKTLAVFYLNGIVLSFLPFWMFAKMHWLESCFSPLLFLTTPMCTYLLNFAYCNTKIKFKHKIDLKRQRKKKRRNRNRNRNENKEEIEAIVGSIFYNNSLFLSLIIFSNFVFLRSYVSSFSLIVSTVGSSAILVVISVL